MSEKDNESTKIKTIAAKDIVKVRKFTNEYGVVDTVVIYTKEKYYVCVAEQELPSKNDLFITLTLKGKCD